MKKYKMILCTALAPLILTACSSGSSGGTTPPPVLAFCADGLDNDSDGLIDLNDPGCADASDNDETDPIVVVEIDELLSGIWDGESFDVAGVSTGFISGVISPPDAADRTESAFLDDDLITYEILDIFDAENDGIFDGRVRAWAAPGTLWPGDLEWINFDITGVVVQGSTLGVTLFTEGSADAVGSIEFTYLQALYERPATLDIPAGIYDDADLNSWDLAADGGFFTADAVGCAYTGTFAVVDATRNVYHVDATSAGCGFTVNTWHGVMIMDDTNVADDTVAIAWSNDGGTPGNQRSMWILTRQTSQ